MKIEFEDNYHSSKYTEICNVFGIKERERLLFEDSDIKPEGITYITGCSGSGKTTLAKFLAEKHGYSKITQSFSKDIPIIDVIDKDVDETLYYLNAVGLSEAFIYLTKYTNLSTGQQFRFDIAYALSTGLKHIYIDEFCSYLDRTTAQIATYNMQKLFRKNNISVIAVSAHDDLDSYLKPDFKITLSLDQKVDFKKINIEKNNPFIERILVKPGSYSDYLELESYHYFDASNDETNKLYNTKYFNLFFDNQLMGIMTFKSPYSNDQDDKELIDINSKLVFLNRIILHPMIRGAGLTKIFFDKVYEDIDSEYIYTCSALAVYIPFFKNLGFQEIEDIDYTHLYEYKKIIQHFNGSTLIGMSDILEYEKRVFSEILYRWYLRYCNIINQEKKYYSHDFNEFVIDACFEEDDIPLLYSEVKYLKMKHYIMNRRPLI